MMGVNMKYIVDCGMRPASNFPAMSDVSTIFQTVRVEADTMDQARTAAIAECHRVFGDVQHVKPLRVRPTKGGQ